MQQGQQRDHGYLWMVRGDVEEENSIVIIRAIVENYSIFVIKSGHPRSLLLGRLGPGEAGGGVPE